jgi:hypothetical protein
MNKQLKMASYFAYSFSLVRMQMFINISPVLRIVDDILHFPVPSTNRLNDTEPATVSIIWALSFDSFFSISKGIAIQDLHVR